MALSLLLILILFIPCNNLENSIKQLTDQFLRKTLTKNNEELLHYSFMIIILLCVSTLGLFIFSMIFFYKVNQIENIEEIGKIIAFTSLSIIGPLLGLIIGGFTLILIKPKVSKWLILIYSFIGIGFTILFRITKIDELMENVYLGLMLLFNMSTMPIVYVSISNMIISKETREFIITIMVSFSNLFGLGGGAYIGGLYSESGASNNLLFYLSISFFFFFLLFFIVYVFKLNKETLQQAEFFQYQLFLLISFVFGKFSLFIWDEYLGESIVSRQDQSFTAQIKNKVDVLYDSNGLSHEYLIQEAIDPNEEGFTANNTNEHNRVSQMTFDQNSTNRVTIDNNKDDFLFEANANNHQDDFSFKNSLFNEKEDK